MILPVSHTTPFADRHHGQTDQALNHMLQAVGVKNMDELVKKTVPASIRLPKPMQLPEPMTETEVLEHLQELGAKNKIYRNFIGMGYYGTKTPAVILRNILENPGWYTAYTPYQAEIAQGRLEMLLNYQTMVTELTGLEIANASLLDEATAAAEAMSMLYACKKPVKKNATRFLVSNKVFLQTIEVLKTRAIPVGIDLVVTDVSTYDLSDPELFGMLLQYPERDGRVANHADLAKAAHANNVFVAVATDLLALTLLTPPAQWGADVALGSAQRFGVPMGYGGPHAAFFATKEEFKRNLPGRIIGQSIDATGQPALRMALQTREQHIRREKATSNICTAQVLLSVMAAAYAVYHGPQGLRKIAQSVHAKAVALADALREAGHQVVHQQFFDTIRITGVNAASIRERAEELKINLRYVENGNVGISVDEVTTLQDLHDILEVFEVQASLPTEVESPLLPTHLRSDNYMAHPVFHLYHTEHEMLRYLKRLENKDISLTHSMISLGSCTMKLNSTTEMIPVTWPQFGNLHPFAPSYQARGYQQMMDNLSAWLCEITGFAGVSLQPNSGAQGEYTGLMAIRAYHHSRGQQHRNVALIPSSAHGTNPASAVMAGMKVVVVKCDDKGNIDQEDLHAKVLQHSDILSCLMVTYPSTHGVFEEGIRDICALVHQHGGQVYMDGANMNAQVGLTSPGFIGADVCHLNLHKTFCIPHGGGGPGMGPIGVAAHLVPFLPGHAVAGLGGAQSSTAVSAAPYGSASILLISYAYIAMMGSEGLTEATKRAILNANYIKYRLERHFSILYTGTNGFAAHEMIVDFRPFKASAGVEVEDVAKRLMDYGYHAPTVSFPVAGTMMIEPTESESLAELDRFCDAMISIRHEITMVEEGVLPRDNNMLKHAPHTMAVVMDGDWKRPYSRAAAAFPLEWVLDRGKMWPTVSRVDGAYGDRNLQCTCAPVEQYAEVEMEA